MRSESNTVVSQDFGTQDRFLDAVAKHCAKKLNSNPSRILVFPNKRAAIYFRGYLRKHIRGTVLMPKIMTIGAFYNVFADDSDFETDPVELLFILYKAYCNVINRYGAEPVDFSRFSFWGWMILSDFNDIDSALANANDLYTNLKRYNEIGSYYLNEEQRRIIAEIWGEKAMVAFTPPAGTDAFWKPTEADGADDEIQSRFIKMWQILGPIYEEFNRLLEQEKRVSPGNVVRLVGQRIKEYGRSGMNFENIAFIGFSNVSIGLGKIMRLFAAWNMADFYWDVLPDTDYNRRAGSAVRKLAEAFPMPEDFDVPGYTKPTIDYVAIPSNYLQTKQASQVIQEFEKNNELDTSRPDNTVIMLPDPSLLTGMLQSLPNEVEAINVTMGLPYRNTPFASVIRNIVSLNMRGSVFRGKLCFFHEDITSLVSQPIMRALAPEACVAIRDLLTTSHQFRMPASALREVKGLNGLECIFAELTDPDSPTEAENYFIAILDAMYDCVCRQSQNTAFVQEKVVLKAYRSSAETVFSMIRKYGVEKIKRGTIFGLLERIFALQKFQLTGSPVRGLQVMEPLETRCVDFDNVIMLSMNESVYPRRKQMRSMIPMSIRRAYGLPVNEDSDDEYAYYFFRLLSRSKHVVCLYDSRANGRGNGAMSRHLLQLKYLIKGNTVREKLLELVPSRSEDRTISVIKDDSVREHLERFRTPNSGKNISASALKNYRKCPLKFYLENVEGLREDDTPEPYMDAVTYGNVMHRVLEDMFNETVAPGQETSVIDAAMISKMRGQEGAIENRILRVIDELYYNGSNKNSNRPLPGESRLLAKMMKDYIERVLDKENKTITEANSGPFTFVAAEESFAAIPRDGDKKCSQWAVTPNTTINFKLIIDRHDKMSNGVHRFVDYKTGGDKSSVESVADLFGQGKKANDAILQLCIYAMAYAELTGFKGSIKPALYRFLDAFKVRKAEPDFELDGVSIGGNQVVYCNDSTGDPEWQKEFRERLNEMIDSIFDYSIPFSQTSDTENCKYCAFTEVCGRVIVEKDY